MSDHTEAGAVQRRVAIHDAVKGMLGIADEQTPPFADEFLAVAQEEVATQLRYYTVLANTGAEEVRAVASVSTLLMRRIDGLLSVARSLLPAEVPHGH